MHKSPLPTALSIVANRGAVRLVIVAIVGVAISCELWEGAAIAHPTAQPIGALNCWQTAAHRHPQHTPDTPVNAEDAPTAQRAQSDAHEIFTQVVPGTVQSIVMRRITPANDSALQSFYMSEAEITWDLYDIFVYAHERDDGVEDEADAVTRPSKPYISMDRGFGKAGYPAISMSYLGAQSFCQWLSMKTGRTYRLPTQLEWQAACQASGVDANKLHDFAWFKSNSDFKTHPVAKLQPDSNGLHDLYGNAAEWCTDEDDQPVVLGGCYRDPAEKLTCAAVLRPTDDWNASDPQIPKSKWWLADGGFVGFRVVCESEGNRTTESTEITGK